MYASYLHAYALKNSGTKSIHDLNGKGFGAGPVGGMVVTYYPFVFEVGE